MQNGALSCLTVCKTILYSLNRTLYDETLGCIDYRVCLPTEPRQEYFNPGRLECLLCKLPAEEACIYTSILAHLQKRALLVMFENGVDAVTKLQVGSRVEY